MNNRQFQHLLNQVFDRLQQLSATKGQEYTQGEAGGERLRNFKRPAENVGDHPLKAWWYYLNKHYESITTFVKQVSDGTFAGHDQLSEPMEGRFHDLILYGILGIGLMRDTVPVDDRQRQLWEDAAHEHAYPTEQAEPPTTLPELQAFVAQWAGQVFPQRTLDTIRAKLVHHELPELMVALGDRDWDKVDDEMVDNVILIMDHMSLRGKDLLTAIRDKQRVNLRRRWQQDANGVSSHIKEEKE